MRFEEFIKDVQSKDGVDVDGYYGKQCMDLYNYYCKNVLGVTGTGAPCAKDIINKANNTMHFEVIKNYPEFVPQKGDVAVWTGGTYGHVAVCLGEGDVNSFKCIEQNWKPQALTIENHNYTYMAPIYFLRPKNQTNIKEIKTNDNIDQLARRVIAGDFGNGAERKVALGIAYNEVQKRVNEILAGNKPQVDINALADAVIRGEYGNGAERKQKLGANYEAVQAEVNRRFK